MMWGYGMWWGSLIWLVLIGAIVWILVANSRSARPTRPTAIDILEERFARGEIDGENYRSTRIELERN
ncbi:MAG: SHOCT domain-containing protein [Acidimicrobiia bacterium]|nr:SHOCT domain-containing protein [Acidimicrobiia bacterium]